MSATTEDRRRIWAMRQAVRAGVRPQSNDFAGAVEFFINNKAARRQFDQQEAVREFRQAIRESAPYRGLLGINEWLSRRLTR